MSESGIAVGTRVVLTDADGRGGVWGELAGQTGTVTAVKPAHPDTFYPYVVVLDDGRGFHLLRSEIDPVGDPDAAAGGEPRRKREGRDERVIDSVDRQDVRKAKDRDCFIGIW